MSTLRIGELSNKSGLSIATIKFYRREGLLPPGRPLRCNQVEYDDGHLYRLRLIRALVEIGDLSLPTIRTLIDATEDPSQPVRQHPPAGSRRTPIRPAKWGQTREQLINLLLAGGWRVQLEAEALDTVADVLVAFEELGHDLQPALLAGYARLARETVAIEMRLVRTSRRTPPLTQAAVFYEKLFDALRRLARADCHVGRRQAKATG
ncbi:MerR family transcriptional regulator [Nonomuraea sp. NPDC052129]|uniref:MerR family transcriptional regulator n=1 Tax=Nonomuraea sp. NPDC052129 TaxID=3154651 RepID=UPI0034322F83